MRRILANAIIFVALAAIFDGFHIESIWVALGASVVFSILNFLVRPILTVLSIPLYVVTLGLFHFVLNAAMLSLTSWFFGSAFMFSSFWLTIGIALIMSIINTLIDD